MAKKTVEELHRNKTGKVSDKWASYLPFYDNLFGRLQEAEVSLLEIGVQNGGSLETWGQYFGNASNIIGCDIDNKCGQLTYADARIRIVVGDANELATFNKICELCRRYDIVIDDGSHKSRDIINSFLLYFPLLRPGGIYVVEDAHALYWNEAGGGILNESAAYNFLGLS